MTAAALRARKRDRRLAIRSWRLLLLLSVVWLHWACRNPRAESPPRAAASSPGGDAGASTLPHGNHEPKYGGVVLMNGDLHFEVVLRRDGRHQVYFSDAARNELPASIASSVSIAVSSKRGEPESVDLQIDEAGEAWESRGRPITDPDATARISFTIRGKPYWIDLPFSAVQASVGPH
jgi:hypothetical protein